MGKSLMRFVVTVENFSHRYYRTRQTRNNKNHPIETLWLVPGNVCNGATTDPRGLPVQ
jgi:hypothetical protein